MLVHNIFKYDLAQNVSTTDKTARPLDAAGDAEEELSVDDVLNRIMPMREWEADGKFFRQRLSNRPATKLEVKKLSDKLDMYLEQYKAREVGLCPIKRELYRQCFSESATVTVLLYMRHFPAPLPVSCLTHRSVRMFQC